MERAIRGAARAPTPAPRAQPREGAQGRRISALQEQAASGRPGVSLLTLCPLGGCPAPPSENNHLAGWTLPWCLEACVGQDRGAGPGSGPAACMGWASGAPDLRLGPQHPEVPEPRVCPLILCSHPWGRPLLLSGQLWACAGGYWAERPEGPSSQTLLGDLEPEPGRVKGLGRATPVAGVQSQRERVCVCVRARALAYVPGYVCEPTCLGVYIYMCVYGVCVCLSVCAWVWEGMCVSLRAWAYTYVCACVCARCPLPAGLHRQIQAGDGPTVLVGWCPAEREPGRGQRWPEGGGPAWCVREARWVSRCC